MNRIGHLLRTLVLLHAVGLLAIGAVLGEEKLDKPGMLKTIEKMVEKFGESNRTRIERGVARVEALWRESDGTLEDLQRFCEESFIPDPETLNAVFDRLERNFESIWGHMHQIGRTLREPVDLDVGDLLPLDLLFASYSPSAHLEEDFFKNRVAFAVALNFPHYSLEEKLRLGSQWSRKEWAKARLGDMFTVRVPAELNLELNARLIAAERYIYDYNIYLDRVLTPEKATLFPPGLRLISHWGLRDEIRGRYGDPEGLPRQELIYRVMLRIIDQSLPAAVINSADCYWEPESNLIFRREEGRFVPMDTVPKGDVRYEHLLDIFKAHKELDSYYPEHPTLLARAFDLQREIPEKEVERLLVSVLSSPIASEVGKVIRNRLGRPLRPFDIWFNGFKPSGKWSEAELDRRVREKYPTADSFQKALPDILMSLGFSSGKANFLSSHIVVDASRGSGHAMPAAMRGDKAHLRTRVPKEGMNYKAFNIAVHELGHNVEQVFSLNGMDYYFLRGVPFSAFTEGVAIMCQNRDMKILGIQKEDPAARDLQALDTFWNTYEIAGVALTEMKVWHWMYEHPQATPEALKDAVIRIAKDVWNQYFEPVLQVKDSPVLGIYSHMFYIAEYLANYPLGHIILFQLEEYMEGRDFAAETERMCRLGSLTPALWMQQAAGAQISTESLIRAAKRALENLKD